MTIFNLEVANFAIDPSGSGPLLFCVADAGIESTPFEREGRAMVTREAGAGAVMAVDSRCTSRNEDFVVYFLFINLAFFHRHRPSKSVGG